MAFEAQSEYCPPLKKQKMAKDAAVFSRGKIAGEMRYPPWESYDVQTARRTQRGSNFIPWVKFLSTVDTFHTIAIRRASFRERAEVLSKVSIIHIGVRQS